MTHTMTHCSLLKIQGEFLKTRLQDEHLVFLYWSPYHIFADYEVQKIIYTRRTAHRYYITPNSSMRNYFIQFWSSDNQSVNIEGWPTLTYILQVHRIPILSHTPHRLHLLEWASFQIKFIFHRGPDHCYRSGHTVSWMAQSAFPNSSNNTIQ